MFGIKFLIKNEYDIILNKIFHGIDCSNFRWKLEDEEVFGEHGEFFCDKTDYINNDFQVKYDLTTNKSFNICFDLSAFSSEYFAMNVDVKIIFNDVHRPTVDEPDQRYLSGIIWRFEIE